MSNEASLQFPIYSWETGTRETSPLEGDATTAIVKYTVAAGATTARLETISVPNLTFNLTPGTTKSIYPASVSFTMAGHTFWDYEGIMYMDGNYVVGNATEAGTIDYPTGEVTLTHWVEGSPVINITSLLVVNAPYVVASAITHTALAPIRPGSLTIAVTASNGDLLTADTDIHGNITGDYISGYVDVDTGIIDLRFGTLVTDADLTAEEKAMDWYDPDNVDENGKIWRSRMVYLDTGRYNCVAYVYLPLSADVLGINPVRLPMDGRVPIFRVGDVIVIHNTEDVIVNAPLTDGQEVDLGRVRIAWAKVYNSNGSLVDTDDYTIDTDAGTVTLVDTTNMIPPLKITNRMEDMALVNDLQIDGTLGITKALSHTFPIESYVSSALITSDLFARVTNIFEQTTWTDVWSDEVIGNTPLAAFNSTAYPITISNKGGTQERWMVKFKTSTTFDVFGEYSGLVASGSTSTDCSPLNPATGVPYFVIPALGWGAGWNTGNILRFNTIAANKPIWVARTVLQSDAYSGEDKFCIEIRGDVDTP